MRFSWLRGKDREVKERIRVVENVRDHLKVITASRLKKQSTKVIERAHHPKRKTKKRDGRTTPSETQSQARKR